jgi:hypothetical protein
MAGSPACVFSMTADVGLEAKEQGESKEQGDLLIQYERGLLWFVASPNLGIREQILSFCVYHIAFFSAVQVSYKLLL